MAGERKSRILAVMLMGLTMATSFIHKIQSTTLHEACDFVFEGHQKFPPFLSLVPHSSYPNAVLNARNGKRVGGIGGVARCALFPGNSDPSTASRCAGEFLFHGGGNRLSTRARSTGGLLGHLSGTGIVLYFSTVKLDNHTLLEPGDGNQDFDENRRCIMFFSLPNVSAAGEELLRSLRGPLLNAGRSKSGEKDDRHESNKRAHHRLRQIGGAFLGDELP